MSDEQRATTQQLASGAAKGRRPQQGTFRFRFVLLTAAKARANVKKYTGYYHHDHIIS
jgi:hypothetical protein